MNHSHIQPLSAENPGQIVQTLPKVPCRILITGRTGAGKSTLARHLARHFARQSAGAPGTAGRPCFCLGADPGAPDFGVPGALCLARWKQEEWQIERMEGMASLNGGRFRLPLVRAAARLARGLDRETLLVDNPGIIRGIAGAELLVALAQALAIQAVLVLAGPEESPAYAHELRTIPADILVVHPLPKAMRPGPGQRRKERTQRWQAYLGEATETAVDLEQASITGTPPPLDRPQAWLGRQAVLVRKGTTLAMGEVTRLDPGTLWVRVPGSPARPDQVKIRDACCNATAGLRTAARVCAAPGLSYQGHAPKAGGPAGTIGLATTMGGLTATLMNGVFGDPLVHIRFTTLKQGLLFDLGSGERLPARLAHQLTHVCITHAHMDHISGFVWLVRARMGMAVPLDLYGPPGLARHIQGMLDGVLWDRIKDKGPRFRVHEVHGQVLRRFSLQAGKCRPRRLSPRPMDGPVLAQTPDFRLRALALDHGTPSLAYGLETGPDLNIRKTALNAMGLGPGPWLGQLKTAIKNGRPDTCIHLPGNRTEPAGRLARDLIRLSPARQLVYATDFADTRVNREQLAWFARNAHTLFCEAAFTREHAQKAKESGHMTATACARIARQARVGRLVPFHFSKRYESRPEQIYDEIRSVWAGDLLFQRINR